MIDHHAAEALRRIGYVVVDVHADTTDTSVIVVQVADNPRANSTETLGTGWDRNDWLKDWPTVEVDEDDVPLPTVLELAKKRVTKKRQIQNRQKRSGRGYDPKLQAACRSKGGGRGRGKR